MRFISYKTKESIRPGVLLDDQHALDLLYLEPDDVVELEIEQIGVLRNRVVRK
jgi:2-keto-4-pentenoate hydratase/2-oxohepta-3-ene-1,7-dioic acid hydratase in catechol pathway